MNRYLVKYSQSIDQNVLREIKEKIAKQNTKKNFGGILTKSAEKRTIWPLPMQSLMFNIFFPFSEKNVIK